MKIIQFLNQVLDKVKRDAEKQREIEEADALIAWTDREAAKLAAKAPERKKILAAQKAKEQKEREEKVEENFPQCFFFSFRNAKS